MKRLFEMLRRSGLCSECDGALLARFREARDEGAFAELVRRHGPLVWGVCRRGLPNSVDAEDAFQAVFLVLIRRADRLNDDVPLGAWLCRTAVWTVQNLRRRQSRRRSAELPTEGVAVEPAAHFELYELLAELPEKYRTPIVLCHLQGWSRKDAAAELGVPEGSLSATLHRGLAKLRRRFGSDPAGPLALLAVAAVPPALSATAVQTLATFGVAAGVSPTVLMLSQGVLRMFWIKKAVAAIVLGAGLTAGVAGLGLVPGDGGQAIAQAPEAKRSPFKAPEPPPAKSPPKKPTRMEEIRAAEMKLEADKKFLEELRKRYEEEENARVAELRMRSEEQDNARQPRIEIGFADAGGWASDFSYTENVGGMKVLAVSVFDPNHLTLMLKRAQADPNAPKAIHLDVIIGSAQQGEKDKVSAIKLVNAVVAAGITKVTYTGMMLAEIDYETKGKEKNFPRDDGTIGLAMSTEPWRIVSDKWTKVDGKEIDLNAAFPKRYRELMVQPAAEKRPTSAITPQQLDRVVTSVSENHFVWLSVGSKAGYKVGDVVEIWRILGEKNDRGALVGSIKLTVVEADKAFGEDTDKPKPGFAPRFLTTDCVFVAYRNAPVKP